TSRGLLFQSYGGATSGSGGGVRLALTLSNPPSADRRGSARSLRAGSMGHDDARTRLNTWGRSRWPFAKPPALRLDDPTVQALPQAGSAPKGDAGKRGSSLSAPPPPRCTRTGDNGSCRSALTQ